VRIYDVSAGAPVHTFVPVPLRGKKGGK
jgi:hypothetical protein